MAAEPGLFVILKVGDGASPTEVFTTLPGQQNTTFGGATETADITDKSNNGWSSSMPTILNGNISVTGVAKWDSILERLTQAWLARTTVNMQLLENEDGEGWAGAFRVMRREITGEVRGATQYSMEFAPDGALERVGVT